MRRLSVPMWGWIALFVIAPTIVVGGALAALTLARRADIATHPDQDPNEF